KRGNRSSEPESKKRKGFLSPKVGAIHTSPCLPPFEKAIHFPSADQSSGFAQSGSPSTGLSPAPGSMDIFSQVLPTRWPPRSDAKKIRRPSGDHVSFHSFAGSFVRRDAIPRPVSSSQTSRLPPLSSGRLKITRVPSREIRGC